MHFKANKSPRLFYMQLPLVVLKDKLLFFLPKLESIGDHVGTYPKTSIHLTVVTMLIVIVLKLLPLLSLL